MSDSILFVWRGRAAKIDAGMFCFSRRGVHDDWDYGRTDGDAAFAGYVGYSANVYEMRKVDEDAVEIHAISGTHRLNETPEGLCITALADRIEKAGAAG